MWDDYSVEMYFYSNACHVCRIYGNNVKLKRCSSCKMIAYCGRDHQRKHWPRHRDLCRVFAEIVQQAGTVFGKRNERETSNSFESWTRAKTNLMLLIQMKIGRKLVPYETEMLQFPRSCDTCHETDSQKLSDCSDCPFTSFCHDHLIDEDHANKCETSRLCFALDTAQYSIADPALPDGTKRNKIPNSMRDLVAIYRNNAPNDKDDKTNFPTAKFIDAFVSEYLTRPYTFLYALRRSNFPLTASTTIHIIGANAIELKSLAYWEILLHDRDILDEIRIILIGPELESETYELELCEDCSRRRIIVECVGKFYSDYTSDEYFERPNYVIGFNLGIHECENLEDDTWAPSVRQLAALNCPFFMTSYTQEESRNERDRLALLLDDGAEFNYSGINPFASLRPYRDFESEDFFYQNQYLTIYEKLR